MGRVSNSDLLETSTPIVNHFSHQHQLQLFRQTLNLPTCSACNLKSSEIMYACLTCNYYLHQTCSRLPDKITHQSHSHQLKVTFSPPYPNQVFSCDICKKTGANQWLYRCDFCEFDAHLNCGSTVQVASQQQNIPTQNQNPSPTVSAEQMFLNSYNNSVNANLAAIAMGVNRQQNEMMNQVFQQTGNDVTSYNRILQGLMAGGTVGGTSQMQGLMGGAGNHASQLQGLMGGAGGAGSPLQTLISGGAGGVDLQSLIGGGGASGVDLQSLMGSTGGAGTADLLQSLLGGGGSAGAGLLQGFLDLT
ncbi:uncharacterized protein LOC141662362 isoform X2 [Apium graveolens]|uniref:uncharacterized protein LOC141662362 isoform X2 n=1 Tax=Apium graveolens TaxID=4045 RepID=UPI003D7B6F9B